MKPPLALKTSIFSGEKGRLMDKQISSLHMVQIWHFLTQHSLLEHTKPMLFFKLCILHSSEIFTLCLSMHSCISFIPIMYIYVFISKPEPHSFIRTTHFRKLSIYLKLCIRYMEYYIQMATNPVSSKSYSNRIQASAVNKIYIKKKCRENLL